MQSAPSTIAEHIVMTLLAARIRGARTVAESHAFLDQHLQTKAAGEQRREHHAGVRYRPLIIKHHDPPIRSPCMRKRPTAV